MRFIDNAVGAYFFWPTLYIITSSVSTTHEAKVKLSKAATNEPSPWGGSGLLVTH